jgi:hypothetical protein
LPKTASSATEATKPMLKPSKQYASRLPIDCYCIPVEPTQLLLLSSMVG